MRLNIAVVLLVLISVFSFGRADLPTAEEYRFGEHNQVHDAEHLKHHLQDKIDVQETELNEEQRRFHYFFMHDLNKDNLIDGNEIIKAMVHEHFTEAESRAQPPPPSIEESSIENMVDSIMREMDANNDGFLSYAEYTKQTAND
uniref:EF-hand domain-containing protein n=1 Tax=Plectus sambesii TaxID=2011161 RepID=A0A914WYY1_9BILA